MIVCLYSNLSCLAYEVYLFYTALYLHLWPVLLYLFFPTSHKQHNFEKKIIELKVFCFDYVYNFYLKNFSF
jgi:hypothetical protein